MREASILFLLILSACDVADIPLTPDYKLSSVHGTTYHLVDKKNRLIIQEKVNNAYLDGKFIIGERVVPENYAVDLHSPIFGCFAINIESGEVVEGLTSAKLQALLTHNRVGVGARFETLTCLRE